MSKKESSPEDLEDTLIDAVEETVAADENRLANLTHEELVVEYNEAQQRADENWDKLVRLQAEMENLRRRVERDVASAHKYGVEKLIKSLLPVVDSLERGLEIVVDGSSEVKAMHEGMELTLKILLETLEKNNVKQLDPVGEPFNPEEMEAVSIQPATEVEPNTVLTVIQKGYLLNARLVRPAMVAVAQ